MASKASVKAGPVTFTLTNKGTKKHEMVVLKTDEAIDGLKVGADNKVPDPATQGCTKPGCVLAGARCDLQGRSARRQHLLKHLQDRLLVAICGRTACQ